jgi:hypothetical protein
MQETTNHFLLINNLTHSFTLFSHLFNNVRKTFATNHKKIANSSFFIYQFNIAKFIPSLGLLLEWGTLKNSFFLRYVTNEIRFTPAALHWGDLIFDTFDADSHKFVIYPYDKYKFSDFLFINTQLRFSHANQEAFSKSKFLYELAQRILDQMNFIPFMTSFTQENLHYI